MKVDVSGEMTFATARSGGKGGQNVNKVETMVEGRWKVAESRLFTTGEKQELQTRLQHKMTAAGEVLVKSQSARTQLGNKAGVIEKMNRLVAQALVKKKARFATKPTKASQERRITSKKREGKLKLNRRKVDW